MRMTESNSVVESKAMPGVEISLHPEVGTSFGSYVARSNKGRGIRGIGSECTVFVPVKDMLRESVERCSGWGRANQLCVVIGVASAQEGREGRQGKGR